MRARRSTCLVALLLSLPACQPESPRIQVDGGDPAAGAELIRRYGCGSCHAIPGIAFARGVVGPPLRNVARQVYLAGVVPNTPDGMIRWLLDPPAIDPRTAMPNVGLTAPQARDIAAYLYRLDE